MGVLYFVRKLFLLKGLNHSMWVEHIFVVNEEEDKNKQNKKQVQKIP